VPVCVTLVYVCYNMLLLACIHVDAHILCKLLQSYLCRRALWSGDTSMINTVAVLLVISILYWVDSYSRDLQRQ